MTRRAGSAGRLIAAGALLATIGVLQAASMASAKTTLTIAMWRNDPPTAKFTQNALAEYGKQNNVTIKFVYAAWGAFLDKVLTMDAAGQIPDVMVVERRWLPRFADNRIVRPLDDVIAADRFDPKAELSDVKSGMYKNHFYGFPVWGGPALHYYNPTIFTKSGVPQPPDLIAAGTWNWDGFLEVGRKLTRDLDGDGKLDQFALDQANIWSPNWAGKIRQNGGDIFDAAYKKVLVNEPAAVAAVQYWADLSLRYNIAPKSGQTAAFAGNKSALSEGWISEAVTWKESYKKRGIDMQLTMYPAGKAGFVTVAGGCPVCVSSFTKNPKEAYKLAKWFAMDSDEWKNTGAPASKAIYEGAYQEYLKKYFTGADVVLKRAMLNSDPEPCINPRHQLIEDAQTACLAPVLAGKASAAQGCAKMYDELTRIINRK